MAEAIQFNEIPNSIRHPGKYIEFDARQALQGLPGNPQKLLLFGQRLSTGDAAEGELKYLNDDDKAAEYFGYGSTIHLMARAARRANAYCEMYGVAMDDGAAGVAATGDVTFDGTCTRAGTLKFRVGNELVQVLLEVDDTSDDVATNLVAELATAEVPALPVTAAVNGVVTDQVDFTAKNKGTVGNAIALSWEFEAAEGITFDVGSDAILTAGSGDPLPADIETVLDGIKAERYHIVASHFIEATLQAKVEAYIEEVSGPLEQRPGRVYYGIVDTLTNATTAADAINHERFALAWLKSTRSLPLELAAATAALDAYEQDPARPLNTLETTGIHAPKVELRSPRVDLETALWNGILPLKVFPGEDVGILRAITTYTENADSQKDPTWLDITTIKTLDYVREAILLRWTTRFPREKLTDRVLERIHDETLDVLRLLERNEILEHVEKWLDKLRVERSDLDVNRVNVEIPADVVNGLHVVAGKIVLIL